MAEQTGIEKANDRNKPNDEKKVVAGGIAITVVIILIIGWAIIFIHNIQNGTQQINLSSGAQDAFNPKPTKDAQQQLQGSINPNQELQDIHDQAANSGQQQAQQQMMQVGGTGPDQFTNTSPTQ